MLSDTSSTSIPAATGRLAVNRRAEPNRTRTADEANRETVREDGRSPPAWAAARRDVGAVLRGRSPLARAWPHCLGAASCQLQRWAHTGPCREPPRTRPSWGPTLRPGTLRDEQTTRWPRSSATDQDTTSMSALTSGSPRSRSHRTRGCGVLLSSPSRPTSPTLQRM
jgi:hypothetical protein